MQNLWGWGLVVLWTATVSADELQIDAAVRRGTIRPLHGVNGGPVNAGGTIDLTKSWKEANFPLTRLHDCEWPGARVVDFSALFPDLNADPESPASYRFAETDDYLASVLAGSPGIVFRLGESIEHTKKKYRVHPPADPQRWADACVGIIRHYNDGWANGFRHKIEYWEIWNEPENRPACWTGTDEEYCKLYETAATTIKKKFPDLKVGGPSVGAIGEVIQGVWHSTEFVRKFLKHCRDNQTPLDFFSWHTYTDNPRHYRLKAEGVRKLLDEYGFAKTEIHLNEWNYLPDNDWGPMLAAGQGKPRRLWYEKMGGPAGAAFLAFTLCDLQDSPVDVANYYTGDSSPFGLFTRDGEPKHTFGAMRAFQSLRETPVRMQATGAGDGTTVLAGINEAKTGVTVLFANYRGKTSKHSLTIANLPWSEKTSAASVWIDDRRNFEFSPKTDLGLIEDRLEFELPAPGVVVFSIAPTISRRR